MAMINIMGLQILGLSWVYCPLTIAIIILFIWRKDINVIPSHRSPAVH